MSCAIRGGYRAVTRYRAVGPQLPSGQSVRCIVMLAGSWSSWLGVGMDRPLSRLSVGSWAWTDHIRADNRLFMTGLCPRSPACTVHAHEPGRLMYRLCPRTVSGGIDGTHSPPVTVGKCPVHAHTPYGQGDEQEQPAYQDKSRRDDGFRYARSRARPSASSGARRPRRRHPQTPEGIAHSRPPLTDTRYCCRCAIRCRPPMHRRSRRPVA